MNDYRCHTEGDDETGDEDYLLPIARPQLDAVNLSEGRWDSVKIIIWLLVLCAGCACLLYVIHRVRRP
jgi:hypothetical protein